MVNRTCELCGKKEEVNYGVDIEEGRLRLIIKHSASDHLLKEEEFALIEFDACKGCRRKMKRTKHIYLLDALRKLLETMPALTEAERKPDEDQNS